MVLARASRLVVGGAAAAVDRFATLAAGAATAGARRRNASESLGHVERLELLGRLADRMEPLEATFLRGPRGIRPVETLVRDDRPGVRVVDLSWTSDYQPALEEVAPRYLRHAENHLAGARAFLGVHPRPVAILIHGYLGGAYATEQRVFPVDWLHRIGLDVVLFTLPFHGVRAPLTRRSPPFPSSDPRINNEGFRQAAGDLADLVAWLRARGHPAVGVMGMSLGGYTTALAATLLPDLAFAVPIIPLASLADFARDHGRLGRDERETAEQHAALDRVHRVVSPLHRPLLLDRSRVLVLAAEADRITPIAHARRLARHFGAPLETWTGGHLLQVGRSEGFRAVGRFLGSLGLLPPR